eukprot:889594-Rhodomonas_salina.1
MQGSEDSASACGSFNLNVGPGPRADYCASGQWALPQTAPSEPSRGSNALRGGQGQGWLEGEQDTGSVMGASVPGSQGVCSVGCASGGAGSQ